MLTVAVVEDDTALRSALVRALRQAGHDTVTAATGTEAIRTFPCARPDVMILDIGLPDADGRDVCLALRGIGVTAPALMLTARSQVHDKVASFEAGADDYLTKPFEIAELIARVTVLARRGGPAQLADGDVHLDPARHSLSIGASSVSLTPTEYRLIARLISRPGEVVRRHSLIAAAWPMGASVSDNTLDVYLGRLRAKLATLESEHEILTARGVGFSWH